MTRVERTLTGLLGGILAIVMLAPTVAAQSLADVARREKVRREAIDAESRLYTNDDLRGGGRLTTGSSRAVVPTTEPGDGQQTGADEETDGNSEADRLESGDGPRDQEYWQNRIAAARAAKERAELLSSALQNRADGLLAEFTAVDDPAQRSVVEQERIEALAELERTGGEIQQYDQDILDIQEEARRAGVLPGWLR